MQTRHGSPRRWIRAALLGGFGLSCAGAHAAPTTVPAEPAQAAKPREERPTPSAILFENVRVFDGKASRPSVALRH